MSHISSSSKQCVTISVGEERSVGDEGRKEAAAREEVEWGGDPRLPAHSPLKRRGQSGIENRKSLTNRLHPAPPTAHCQNTKLFPDPFEAAAVSIQGNSITSRSKHATASHWLSGNQNINLLNDKLLFPFFIFYG